MTSVNLTVNNKMGLFDCICVYFISCIYVTWWSQFLMFAVVLTQWSILVFSCLAVLYLVHCLHRTSKFTLKLLHSLCGTQILQVTRTKIILALETSTSNSWLYGLFTPGLPSPTYQGFIVQLLLTFEYYFHREISPTNGTIPLPWYMAQGQEAQQVPSSSK